MKAVREICISGPVIDVTLKMPSGNHKKKRAAKVALTSDSVQKNNDRLSAKHLTRIINANFDVDSWHDTLTYRTEPTQQEAKKKLTNFIRRLSYAMKKVGQVLKWVVATEFENKRIHHHFITNAPLELVKETWKEGHVLPRPFDTNPNYSKLADYIIKETAGGSKLQDGSKKIRYSHSRNLIIPEIKREYVAVKQLFEDPKAWKGYYIDQDSVNRFEHPLTGLEHLEYSMISLNKIPRKKKHYQGTKIKPKTSRTFKVDNPQQMLSLEVPF